MFDLEAKSKSGVIDKLNKIRNMDEIMRNSIYLPLYGVHSIFQKKLLEHAK